MIAFPNCKINIGLSIGEKRTDGFHNLETVFFPIHFFDVIEILPSKSGFEFSDSGIIASGNIKNNICYKAWKLLHDDFKISGVRFHLHKNIPIGAGLGGGSANGTFALKMLNDFFQLNLSFNQLLKYALELGSDCPFFLINKPCFAKGRGEIFEQIDLNLSRFKILIVNPKIHISTALAFQMLNKERVSTKDLKEKIKLPIQQWQENIINDFEQPVFEAHPAIEKIKNQLLQSGAIYASMSGTGSTCYGIFENEIELNNLFPSNYFTKWV